MKCSEIQRDLPIYADGAVLSAAAAIRVEEHLAKCPLCRGAHSEYVDLISRLRSFSRVETPGALTVRLRTAVASERHSLNSWLPIPADVRVWLVRSFVPYGVGVVASLLLAFGFLTILNSSAGRYTQFASARPSDRDPLFDVTVDGISPASFAQSRMNVASESPSVNPQGALVALSRSIVRGEMRDDEVVVVADVFSNGLAQIAEVIEPSRDRRAVEELQKALSSDPAYAPFVPSRIENRPESVRVILRFQSVNVKTNLSRDARNRL